MIGGWDVTGGKSLVDKPIDRKGSSCGLQGDMPVVGMVDPGLRVTAWWDVFCGERREWLVTGHSPKIGALLGRPEAFSEETSSFFISPLTFTEVSLETEDTVRGDLFSVEIGEEICPLEGERRHAVVGKVVEEDREDKGEED